MRNQTLTLLTLSALLGAAPGMASTSAEAYPVIRSETCPNILVPDQANGFYYSSKDCKTIFVLPREKAPLEISGMTFGPGVRATDCERALNITAKEKVIEDQIVFLNTSRNEYLALQKKKLDAATPEQQEMVRNTFKDILAEISAAIKDYQNDLLVLKERLPYSKWDGAVVNLHMGHDVGSDVNAYQTLNKNSGVTFKAAPIHHGIISFATTKDSGTVDFRTVIGATIPGLSASGDDRFAGSTHLVANGGLSGLVVLSQPAVCTLIETLQEKADGTKLPFSRNLLKPEDVSLAGFVANYIYEVPVTTEISFEFKASSKPEDIEAIWTGRTEKKETTQEAISNILFSGELKNNLHVSYKDGGKIFDLLKDDFASDDRLKTDSTHIFNYLFGNAMDLYLEMVIARMKEMNLLQEVVKSKVEAVDGKEAFNSRVVTDCRWRTRWGKARKKCSSHVVKDRYFIDGVSTARNVANNNLAISLDWKVDAEQTLTMKHTAGFVQQKKAKE